MNVFNIDLDSVYSRVSDVTAAATWYAIKETATGVRLATEGEASDAVSRYDLVAGAAATCIKGGDVPMIANSAIAAAAEVCVSPTSGRIEALADATAGAIVIGKLTNGSFALAAGDEVVVTLYSIGQRAKA